MLFCCRATNDLYRSVTAQSRRYRRAETLDEALVQAESGEGVLLLADSYPCPGHSLDEETLRLVTAKRLRVLVEYPASVAGLTAGEPRRCAYERLVVTSDFFGPDLPEMSILSAHGCWFVPMPASASLLTISKVAGYRRAVHGVGDDAQPALFCLPGTDILVVTTSLSNFITGRYSPAADWKTLWMRLLQWLEPSDAPADVTWTPRVRPTYHRDEALSPDSEQIALRRSLTWWLRHGTSAGGSMEGRTSRIDYLGEQMLAPQARSDEFGEAAMCYAHDWALTRNPECRLRAGALLDQVWLDPGAQETDASKSSYGLVHWGVRNNVFYHDDNARLLLGSLTAANLIGERRWDAPMLRCILANFRTTGPLGFRRWRLDYPEHFPEGRSWRYWWTHPEVNVQPHYQASMWTVYLLLYEMTHYLPLLSRTLAGLRKTMEVYPRLRWTNGISGELGYLLWPLSVLVRVRDTKEHRTWLRRVAADLVSHMQPCGAVREIMGPLEDGDYPSPSSNQAVGTDEASAIQENGDPCADLMYTGGFAIVGLHEAAAASGDPALAEAEAMLMEFLVRVQTRSEDLPYLDGCWLRCFDYDLWEPYGSIADWGWGPYGAQHGWNNAWIPAVMAMRRQGETLCSLSPADALRDAFPDVLAEMLEDEA